MSDPASSAAGVERPVSVEVVVADEQTDVVIDAGRWARLAAAALTSEGVTGGELTLTFVDRDEIAALNVEHLGHEGPTDVLSFPLDAVDAVDPIAAGPLVPADLPLGDVLLGDVVVCPAVAAEAAPTHAGTLDDELALLVVHGVLHVLGYDHAEPDETAVMRERELALLVEHHWHGPAPAGFAQEQAST